MYRLLRYSRDRYGTDPIDESGLVHAAERVVAEVQRQFRRREASIERAEAVELYWAQRWALDAVVWMSSHRVAKETQVRLAEGRPLTICVGSGRGRSVVTVAGTFRISGGGCFRVFEDATRPSGVMWAQWCEDCRPSKGKKNRLRSEERALKRRVHELEAMRASWRASS